MLIKKKSLSGVYHFKMFISIVSNLLQTQIRPLYHIIIEVCELTTSYQNVKHFWSGLNCIFLLNMNMVDKLTTISRKVNIMRDSSLTKFWGDFRAFSRHLSHNLIIHAYPNWISNTFSLTSKFLKGIKEKLLLFWFSSLLSHITYFLFSCLAKILNEILILWTLKTGFNVMIWWSNCTNLVQWTMIWWLFSNPLYVILFRLFSTNINWFYNYFS